MVLFASQTVRCIEVCLYNFFIVKTLSKAELDNSIFPTGILDCHNLIIIMLLIEEFDS
jgi:hypothetical protein